MKEYRAYMCDFGHQWTLFKDKQDPEDSGDCVCSEGHPAVTLSKEPALDDVQITFRPAGRVVDTVKEQVHGRGKYYIVISNLAGTQERVSKKVYSWEEPLTEIADFLEQVGEKDYLELVKEFRQWVKSQI